MDGQIQRGVAWAPSDIPVIQSHNTVSLLKNQLNIFLQGGGAGGGTNFYDDRLLH